MPGCSGVLIRLRKSLAFEFQRKKVVASCRTHLAEVVSLRLSPAPDVESARRGIPGAVVLHVPPTHQRLRVGGLIARDSRTVRGNLEPLVGACDPTEAEK